MATVLYLKASPRHGRSHSIAVADAFIKSYAELHPDDEVIIEDLFSMDLPDMDRMTVEAKYAILHGGAPGAEQVEAWREVEHMIEDFTSADKYVFAVPMWNFGIPYKLKHYLDVIVQPGYTFSFSPESGYQGLVTGKPALVVYASGGVYEPGTPGEDLDFQRRYLEMILGFIGFEKMHTIVVEPTLQEGHEVAMQKRDAAIRRALHVAKEF
jgi:FMN-dependent NADH-azoreductase